MTFPANWHHYYTRFHAFYGIITHAVINGVNLAIETFVTRIAAVCGHANGHIRTQHETRQRK